MRFRRWLSILWLLATLLPIAFMAVSTLAVAIDMSSDSLEAFEQRFDTLFNLSIAINLLMLALMASYLVYMFTTPYVPQEKRLLWVAVLFFGNIVAMPFFWYWYVWLRPGSQPGNEPVQAKRTSRLVPAMIGAGMFSIIPLALIIGAYAEGHSYADIADAFPLTDKRLQSIEAGRVSISRRQEHWRGVSLGEVMGVSIGKDAVRFEPSLLGGLLYRSFEVTEPRIHSCSKQCGGGTDYILILDQLNVQIDIERAPELLDWCWENRIPLLLSSQRRAWLYSGEALPTQGELTESLADRATYNDRAKRACLGY